MLGTTPRRAPLVVRNSKKPALNAGPDAKPEALNPKPELYTRNPKPLLTLNSKPPNPMVEQETILTKGLPRKAPNGTGALLPVDYTDPKAGSGFISELWEYPLQLWAS